jgi:hypothetical protein
MLPRLIAEAFAGRRTRRQETAAPPLHGSAAFTSASEPKSDQPSE